MADPNQFAISPLLPPDYVPGPLADFSNQRAEDFLVPGRSRKLFQPPTSTPSATMAQAAGAYDAAVQTPTPIDGAAAQTPSPPTADPTSITARPQTIPATSFDQTVAWWVQNGGVPLHVAQGIADNVARESYFRPDALGDGGRSYGLYQAKDDRRRTLEAMPNFKTSDVQHAWALNQVHGGDPIATAHWNEILKAPTREEAGRLWKEYFERPAGSAGALQTSEYAGRQTQATQELQGLRSRQDKIFDELNKPDVHSEERWRLAKEAMETGREYERKALELAERPPSATPIDSMQKLGGLATLVGILGGLLTKTPLTASLNAGGAAMEAYKAKDDEAYKRNIDQFRYHVDALNNYAKFELGIYKDILEDERLSSGERMNRLAAQASILGNEAIAVRAQMSDERAIQFHYDSLQKSQEQFQFQWQKFIKTEEDKEADRKLRQEATDLRRDLAPLDIQELNNRRQKYLDDHGGPMPPEEEVNAIKDIRKEHAEGGGEKLEVSKSFDIVDDKGKVVRQVMARERRDKVGWIDSETGEPIKLEPGQHLKQITPTTSGGGRAGAQIIRQQVGGREVLSDLQNAVSLPVGTTIGLLGTVHTGPSVLGALQGDMVRHLSDQDALLMQASMASMTRELSILMSPVYGGNWAAQQIDPLVPKGGDPLPVVLFKLARLAQSADNALEAVSKSPLLSNEQQQYSLDLQNQIKEAIPWTPKQAVDFAHKELPAKETFGEFVKKNVAGADSGGGPQMPPWANKSATGPNNEKIYSPDGENWFHADHTLVQ